MNCIIILAFSIFVLHQVSAKTFIEDMTITKDQKNQLDKFKELVISRMPNEWMKKEAFLIRWLRARNYNLKESENMLMEYVQWRKENKIDNIFDEDWTEFRERYKYYLNSRDKEGRPVLYFPVSEWDLRTAILSGKGPKLERYADLIFEESCRLVRELGQKYKNVSQGILMFNVAGFSLTQIGCLRCLPLVLKVVFAADIHYPGCSEKIILINAFAEPILQAIRGVLSPTTNESLKVMGTNKNLIKEFLSKYFDDDQLPFELGGSMKYRGLDYFDDDDYSL